MTLIPMMDAIEDNLVGSVFLYFNKRFLNAATLANAAYRPLRELHVESGGLPTMEQDFIREVIPDLAEKWKKYRESIWHAGEGVQNIHPEDILAIMHASCMEVVRLTGGELRPELQVFMAWCAAVMQKAPNDQIMDWGNRVFPGLHVLDLDQQLREGMHVLKKRYPVSFPLYP